MDNQVLRAEIDSLSHDGRGVSRIDGKVYFIDLALPGELVHFQRGRKRRSYETGKVVEVLRKSPHRVEPPCEYFGTCGGCAMQHLAAPIQILAKQDQLKDNLDRIAKAQPEIYAEPITGPGWGYRRKARLGIRFVPKKGGVLVGFRERNKSYITPLQKCMVLDAKISKLLPAMKTLLEGMSCYDRIPQIEVAVGDNETSLVFRHLVDLTESDLDRLRAFAEDNVVQVFLQPKGLDSVYPHYPSTPKTLSYSLTEHNVTIEFEPTDFIQVNADINQKLINAAIDYMNPQPGDNILDLFCGLGNFTLPIARRAGTVWGVEGDRDLVQRARKNAAQNQINNINIVNADLYADEFDAPCLTQTYDKVLLDPPRTGAIDAVKILNRLEPHRVVYISCNPATLARDAEVLVHKLGFNLKCAGVVDMFPHTNHVESIAVFEK